MRSHEPGPAAPPSFESPSQLGDWFASVIVDLAPDGILVTDEAGRIVLVNRQLGLIFGYVAADLIGRRVEQLIPPRFHAEHLGHRSDYSGDPSIRPMGAGRDLWGLHNDGSEVRVEISLSPISVGTHLHTVVIVREITPRPTSEQAGDGRYPADELGSSLRHIHHAALSVALVMQDLDASQADRLRAALAELDAASRVIQGIALDP